LPFCYKNTFRKKNIASIVRRLMHLLNEKLDIIEAHLMLLKM